jgi:PAS domain S-box-containing protein
MLHLDPSTQVMLGKALFHLKDMSITLLSLQGVFLFWNKGATLLDGYAPDEILGKPLDILHPQIELNDKLSEYMLNTASKEGSVKHIGRRMKKDGTIYVASVVVNGIVDENGNTIGYLRIARELKPNEID